MLYNKITSITDQPILDTKSDLLEAENMLTLSSFILESGTPLTIGNKENGELERHH